MKPFCSLNQYTITKFVIVKPEHQSHYFTGLPTNLVNSLQNLIKAGNGSECSPLIFPLECIFFYIPVL
jgi:hypothetical protein